MKKELLIDGNNILAESSHNAHHSAQGLWSLPEMLDNLGFFIDALKSLDIEEIKRNYANWDVPLPDTFRPRFSQLFVVWQSLARQYDFPNVLTTTEYVIGSVVGPDKTVTPEIAANSLIQPMTLRRLFERVDQLNENYQTDAANRHVFWLNKDRSKYYDKDFGLLIGVAFPSAYAEIVEANTCYALGRDTGAVFHLMRAVEHVLRAVAIAVGVTAPVIPLEYQMWENLIDQIEKHSSKAYEKWAKENKANARAFFNRIIADFYSFKDDIRNVMMHTRTGGTYDQPRAFSVMTRVRECFERVATKIDENTNANDLLDPAMFAKP